jgi:hypothetical protein
MQCWTGWNNRALQIFPAEKQIALVLRVLEMERLASVIPSVSHGSFGA